MSLIEIFGKPPIPLRCSATRRISLTTERFRNRHSSWVSGVLVPKAFLASLPPLVEESLAILLSTDISIPYTFAAFRRSPFPGPTECSTMVRQKYAKVVNGSLPWQKLSYRW